MKTIIASLLLVSYLANPAAAQSKKMNHKAMNNCPAKTCTDHSYDQAYSAPQNSYNEVAAVPKKDCPAATCTDHSYDQAYSASTPFGNRMARRMQPVTNATQVMPSDTWVRMNGNERSYSMNEFIYYGKGVTGINRPTAYEGDNAPTYDGYQKNAYRNMRANNDSEPLPANNGQ